MLKVGWATKDFTPTRPAMIQGQKRRRIGTEAIDPLTTTALVLDADAADGPTALVSCDIPMIPASLWQLVRQKISSRLPAIAPENIVIAGTHTHASVVIEDIYYVRPDDKTVMTPQECEERVAGAISDAIEDAWQTRSEQSLGRAFGHAVVGHNRHAVYNDGHAQMYGKTNTPDFSHFGGYEDHSVDMLFSWDTSGTLAGIVLCIPCPSQVTENIEVFSADYWHDVREALRKKYGSHLSVLGLCGIAGDQSPHLLVYNRQEREMRERRGLTERQEIARRVLAAVEDALACTEPDPTKEWPLLHRSDTLSLTPRAVTRQERDWAEEQHECVTAAGEVGWWPEYLQKTVDIFEGRCTPDPVPAEIHVIRLGDMVIATNPFELFMDYGMRIKTRSPAAQTMTVQLAGQGFYLPSERYIAGGGYGVVPAVSAAGPRGGAELVEATVRHIQELFPA